VAKNIAVASFEAELFVGIGKAAEIFVFGGAPYGQKAKELLLLLSMQGGTFTCAAI
jgi:hypothetical protein